MIKTSAIVIAKNEEKNIKDCLKSVSWADELLVIDSGSTDKTISIAKKAGARAVSFTSGKNYSDWRNKGLDEAKGLWIFYIDADERATPKLKKEILQEISSKPLNVDHFYAYAIPRRNFIFGKEFKYGGQWPDYQIRLFKKDKLKKWTGDVHEKPSFEGKLGHFKEPMKHFKENDLTDMVDKTNDWSEIEARLMYKAAHPKMNIPRFVTAMTREFWLRFVRQLAFLDGPKGIIYGLYQVYSKFISYAKLWEIQITNK